MYIVQMKNYTAAQARQHLSDLLTCAERGQEVIIERRGVQFALSAVENKKVDARRRSMIDRMDPSVADASWSWNFDGNGLAFEVDPLKRER